MTKNLVNSSYQPEDCVFLLENYTDKLRDLDLQEKEEYIRCGGNYSEVISKERAISKEELEIFQKLTMDHAKEIAEYVGSICQYLYLTYGKEMVFVSLARAGSPVGVLMKRYISYCYGKDIHHYSISIIRGKGIDEVALDDIRAWNPGKRLCFIDGWTGKGSITKELERAIEHYNKTRNTKINHDLIVLMDPAKLSAISGTRKDVCLPNACLNSTVSGLVSRTICPKDIKPGHYHGAKYLKQFKFMDVSEWFLFEVSKFFTRNSKEISIQERDASYAKDLVEQLMKEFSVDETKVKLSIGESSRALIRRIPKVLLVKHPDNPNLSYVLHLAKKKGVPIVSYDTKDYECIAILQ